jgi:tetratricopeptide (TPR) repeat protein
MAYQSEIEKLEQRYEENPKQWFAALADAYRKEGSLDLALDYVRGGLEMRPNYASGYIVLGRCLMEKNEHAEAAQAFEQVLELDAENIIALKSLSEIAETRADLGAAKHWLERLIEVDPMNDEARQALERLRQAPAIAAEAESEVPSEPEAVPTAEEGPAEAPAEVSPEPGAAWAAEAMAQQPPEPSPVAEMEEEPFRIEHEEEPLQVEKEEAPFGVGETTSEPFRVTTGSEDLGLEVLGDDGEHGAAGLAAKADEREAEADQASETTPTTPLEAVEAQEEPPVAAFGDVAAAERVTVEDAEVGEVEALPSGADVAAEHLDVSSFDDELAWDTGDRLSHEISSEDIAEAEQHHEDIAPAVEFLEGLPAEDQATEAAMAPVDGLEVVDKKAGEGEDEADRETVEDVADFGALQAVPVISEDALVESARPPAAEVQREEAVLEAAVEEEVPAEYAIGEPAHEEPEEPVAASEAEPVSVEAAEPEEADVGETELPLIMPAESAPREEETAELREPEPVVTETMAEVYAGQGLLRQARQTYEKLVEQRPGDPALKARLADLTERSRSAARRAPKSRYIAAETGGPSAVAYLKQVFAGEAVGDLEPPGDTGQEPERVEQTTSPLQSAFGDGSDEAEAPGSPTIPAPDEVSLSSVFGEPAPPQPAPATGTTEEPPPRSTAGVSFDEFYGKSATEEATEEEEQEPVENGDDDDSEEEFRDWLEGLKS